MKVQGARRGDPRASAFCPRLPDRNMNIITKMIRSEEEVHLISSNVHTTNRNEQTSFARFAQVYNK